MGVAIAASLGASDGRAQAGSAAHAAPPAVQLPFTERRDLRSERLGQDYQVLVRVPESYATSSKRYPVAYVMDGDLMFQIAHGVVQYLEWGKHVPELVIVSPAYGSINGPPNGTNMRDRDYSVFPNQQRYVPGGGEAHLRFLREELIPYVEREFRVDSADRTLVGGSRAGEFTVYALFPSPELFRRYVAIDAYNAAYLRLEDSLAARRPDLSGKRVFLSSRYPSSGVQELAQRLRSRGYREFEVEDASLASARHFATPGEGLARGLKSVFNKRSVYETLLALAPYRSADTLIAEYRRLRTRHPGSYDFTEGELTELGNALVLMKRPADAVRIYTLNLESYPRSSETLSRLGSAYEAAGQSDKALESFRRALTIDPNNRYAANAVKRLEGR